MGTQKRICIYVGYAPPTIIRYLEPLQAISQLDLRIVTLMRQFSGRLGEMRKMIF